MPPTPSAVFRLASARPDAADPHLLRRFLAARDEDAFAELVRRHGPMVRAVCRRVLGHPDDADDAFQAAFLVLARKAGSVRGANLAGWLYAVAVRTARGVRLMRDRRLVRSQESGVRGQPEGGPVTDVLRSELAEIVDEELAGLPECYRAAVVLCELQGRSRKDAAADLGVPEGTLSSRLAKARRLLADRLTKRGVTAPAAAVVAALAPVAGPVSAELVGVVTRAALVDGVASGVASAVADGVVKTLLVAKLKAGAVAVGLLAGLVGGVGLVTAPGRTAAGDVELAPAPRPAADPAELMNRLGADEFAAREAAGKALRALGTKAQPALKEAARDPNPEVARRAAEVLKLIRADAFAAFTKAFDPAGTADYEHPVWQRFKRVAGGGPEARRLFAAVIADPARLATLDALDAAPATAGDVYRGEVRDGDRRLQRRLAIMQAQMPWPGTTAGEVGYVLYLGTFPGSGVGAADADARAEWAFGERASRGEYYLRQRLGLADMTAPDPDLGTVHPAMERVFLAWLVERDHPETLTKGFAAAEVHGYDRLTLARTVVANTRLPAKARAVGLPVLARLGTAADVPVLETLFADESVVDTFRFTGAVVPGSKYDGTGTVLARDYAVGLALLLHGQDPAKYGFTAADKRFKVVDGKPDLTRYEPFHFGFQKGDDDGRPAAHKKARAWLDEHDPRPAALVKRLGAADFAVREAAGKALRALGERALPALKEAARGSNPEVARRAADLVNQIRADALAALARSFDPAAATTDYDHPVWRRFKTVAGDDAAARALFAELIRKPARLRLLADAEADPDRAGDLYQREVDAANAKRDKNDPPNSGRYDVTKVYTWPEVVATVYLGTYPASGRVANPGWGVERIVLHPDYTGTAAGKRAELAARRVFAAWLERRADERMRAGGFALATTYDVAEALPFARAVAGDRSRSVTERLAALPLVARLGTVADLPLFAAFFDDPTGLGGSNTGDGLSHKQVRDVAIGYALLLCGEQPADHGFPLARGRFRDAAGRPDVARYAAYEFGFREKEPGSREATLTKARAWLAGRVKEADDDPAGVQRAARAALGPLRGYDESVRRETPNWKPDERATWEGIAAANWHRLRATALDRLGALGPAARPVLEEAAGGADAKVAEVATAALRLMGVEIEPTPGLLADLDNLDKLRAGYSTDWEAVEKRGAGLLAKYPRPADRGRVYFTLTRVYSNSGIDKTFARVEKYGRLALKDDPDPARRATVYSALASAAAVATAADPLATDPLPVKRKRAAGIVLEGYKELLPLKLPAVAPELPSVEKVGDINGPERAKAMERNAEQMKAWRQAAFVRDMVGHRDIYVRQLKDLYGRDPKADTELRELVTKGLNDPAAAADLLGRLK